MIKLKEKEVKLYKNLVFLILNYSPEETNFILKYVGISAFDFREHSLETMPKWFI